MKKPLIASAFLVVLLAGIALRAQNQTPQAPSIPGKSASESAKAAPASAEVPSGAQLPQPSAAPNASVAPRKKFKDMTLREEEAVVAEIKKLDLPAIFQTMIDAKRVENDSRKQLHLQTVFANAFLRKKPSPEFLEQMYGFITNPANSDFERHLLIGALESAATKETVELLLRVAKTAPDEKFRKAAATLSGVGSNSLTEREVSPIMERTWQETSNPTLLRSTAAGMAKIGTPSGIELLLSAALATDDRDKARQQAAYSALQEVYKRDAVPPLSARLADQPPTSEAVKLVAPVLARIGDATASKALVDWLQGRSENAAPLIHDLIRQRWLGDPFESAWATAVGPAVPFKNEENRKAIREALDAYRAGRTRR